VATPFERVEDQHRRDSKQAENGQFIHAAAS